MLFITRNNHTLKRLSSYYVTRQVCHHTWFEKLEGFVVLKVGNWFLLYLVEQFQLELNSICKKWIELIVFICWIEILTSSKSCSNGIGMKWF